ncbi:MAG: hypothetical protein JF612_07585 [Planctomycetia bacterium]|nr:hypothetical protein [Planctomycetia bacterium]
MPPSISRRQFSLATVALGSSLLIRPAAGQGARKYAPVIPGTGIRVARTGDDFELEDWTYYPQHPKSSWNIDENVREPGSSSKNGMWAEGAKRGTPDVVRRVATPPGGIDGSKGSMLIQTLHSGIPGTLTHEPQQDDLLHNNQATAGTIPVSWSPNVVCRVYVPPTQHWEKRNGATFGYRTGLIANEEYWPGIFLHMERVQKDGKLIHQVRAWIRADNGGRDLPSLTFEPETWITMGMSHTPDGAVHFFLRPGIDDLTKEDCVGSYWCYGYRAHTFQTFFFNVINNDDGRSVSTPWIVDDAFLFAASAPASKIRMAGGSPAPAQQSTTR